LLHTCTVVARHIHVLKPLSRSLIWTRWMFGPCCCKLLVCTTLDECMCTCREKRQVGNWNEAIGCTGGNVLHIERKTWECF